MYSTIIMIFYYVVATSYCIFTKDTTNTNCKTVLFFALFIWFRDLLYIAMYNSCLKF